MKVKEIHGQLVAVMSIKEAVVIGTIMSNFSSTNLPEIASIGAPLWELYDYPEDFLGESSYGPITVEQANMIANHVDGIIEGEEL
jgi:hypothetical protein